MSAFEILRQTSRWLPTQEPVVEHRRLVSHQRSSSSEFRLLDALVGAWLVYRFQGDVRRRRMLGSIPAWSVPSLRALLYSP